MYTIIIFFFLSWKFKLNLESIQFFRSTHFKLKVNLLISPETNRNNFPFNKQFFYPQKITFEFISLELISYSQRFFISKIAIFTTNLSHHCHMKLFRGTGPGRVTWSTVTVQYKHCTTYKIISFSNFSQQLLNEIFWKLYLIPKILFLTRIQNLLNNRMNKAFTQLN